MLALTKEDEFSVVVVVVVVVGYRLEWRVMDYGVHVRQAVCLAASNSNQLGKYPPGMYVQITHVLSSRLVCCLRAEPNPRAWVYVALLRIYVGGLDKR